MKYIFLILICFIGIAGYSQPIVNRAGATQTVQDARWRGQLNAFMPIYADTTAANVQKGIDSAGAIIFTRDVNALWYRTKQKYWSLIGSGGGGSGRDSLFAKQDSTATGIRYFNAKQNSFSIDSSGSYVILAYDTFNHFFTKLYLDTTYAYMQVSSNDFNTFGSISVTKGNATMSASSPDSGHQVVVNNGNVTVRDLRNRPSKLVITGISTGTDTVFAPTQILVLQGDTVKSARYPSLSPTDTANLSYRIDTVGKIIYIDTTQYLRFNLTDSILYSIPVNGVFANGLISTGGINLLDSTITILPNIVFVRNDTTYTLTSSASFIINSTATGYYRTDLIYIDSNNIVQHLVGIEDTVITVPPSVPYKGIGVAIVNVHNSTISSTVIPTNNNWVVGATNNIVAGADSTFGTASNTGIRTNVGGVGRSLYPREGGFLLYGIGTTQMNAIVSPLAGTIVYNNDSLAYCYYNGAIWQKMGSGSGGGGGTITHAVDSLYTLSDSLLLVHYSPYNRTDTFSWRGSGGSSSAGGRFTTNGYAIFVDSTSSLYTVRADSATLSLKYLRRTDSVGNTGYSQLWRLNKVRDSLQTNIDTKLTGTLSATRILIANGVSSAYTDTSFRYSPTGLSTNTNVYAGLIVRPTPTATANGDTIVGLNLRTTYNVNGKTGVIQQAMRVNGTYVNIDSLYDFSYGTGSAAKPGQSNFFGQFAGGGATSANGSNFLGYSAGLNATSASNSNFFGNTAGGSASAAPNSNFFGNIAGQNATNANASNFFGNGAGFSSTNANNSNFFGTFAGTSGTSADNSNFFGQKAGALATSASNSNFFGNLTGLSATGASFSNFFGYHVGDSLTHKITGSNNILIGTNITTPTAASTNMASIGNVLYLTNTYSTTSGNPATAAQTTGQVGINVNAPATSAALDITSTTAGFLQPRMTTTQRDAIGSPATGLKIFNTTNGTSDTYNGTNWGEIIVSSAGTLTLKHGSDYIFTGTTTTWTLPAVSSSTIGRQNGIKIKNRGSGAITLNSNAGSTLYNTAAQSTINIAAGAAVELLPDGTYFNIMFNL